jgi:HEAT repeat protein
VEDLINLLLMHNNASERGKAALKLGEIGDARSVEPLIKALEDGDRKMPWKAAWALGEIGDTRAVEPLIRVLKVQFPVDQELLRQSVLALVKIGAQAVESLIIVLREGADVLTRSLAAQILGQIGDTRAVEPLTEALKDNEEHVRKAAEEALLRLELGEAH